MTDDSQKAFEAWANTHWKDASPGAVEMLAIKRNGEYKYSGARACCIAFCAGLEVGRASRDAEVSALKAECFTLAAGHCIIDGLHGLTADEGGTPYCGMKKEMERWKREADIDAAARVEAEAEVERLRGLIEAHNER